MDDFQLVPTRGGVRLVQHGVLLSHVRDRIGPTHTLYDVLAAAVQALAPGPRLGLLGFAGGGCLAPLRALGWDHPVWAVDLDRRGHRVFRNLCRSWAGRIHWEQAEASAWLGRHRRRFDMIVEDLSVARGGDVWKPEVSWTALPGLVQRRLRAHGVGLFNLLRPENRSWDWAMRRVFDAGRPAWLVRFHDYENRLVVTGGPWNGAREVSMKLGRALERVGSRMRGRIRVSRWA